jgi:hypothetical protein
MNTPGLYPVLLFLGIIGTACHQENNEYLKISAEEYRDKMKAAWVGQMAGVGWGLPTEFDYTDAFIPVNEVPAWHPDMVNQQGNDDLYVEMTFLASMENHGLDVSIRQAGIDFANTGYTLWAANKAGRENLRFGIAPPESSHPQYSNHCDDIDYQIEADYSGIIAPGMPNIPIELGSTFGRLMNYGDGLYGGQFVGGMYSAAYFEKDMHKIIEAGLSCIPEESHYALCIRDVVKWYREYPEDWITTWKLIEEKYHRSKEYQQFAVKQGSWVPIDAKINGAYIVMGLLYGQGDMDSTIVISMRGGKDSDCNPSNAAGVLSTIMGYEKLPEKFKSGLDENKKFSYSKYNFKDLIDLSERFTREYILKNGGKIVTESDGTEYFYIPRIKPVPLIHQPSYDPGPYNPDNKYSEEEMAEITAYSFQHFLPLFEHTGMKMEIRHCGKGVKPEFIEWNNRKNVIATIPMNETTAVKIFMLDEVEIPEHKNGYFSFSAGHEKNEKWKLKVRKGRDYVIDTLISDPNGSEGWMNFKIDISEFAGQEMLDIGLFAEQAGSQPAVNYWADFRLEAE